MLQSFHDFHGLSLDSLHVSHHVPVSLVLGNPEEEPVLRVCPCECWIEGKDCLTELTGNTKAALDAVGLLCHEVALLAHGQLVVHHNPRSFLQLGGPSTQWYTFLLICKKLYSSLLNFRRFLSGSPACSGPSGWQHNPLLEQALFPVLYDLLTVPSSRSLMEMSDSTGPSICPCGTPLVNGLPGPDHSVRFRV